MENKNIKKLGGQEFEEKKFFCGNGRHQFHQKQQHQQHQRLMELKIARVVRTD